MVIELFALPAEIRNLIYHHSLVLDFPIKLKREDVFRWDDEKIYPILEGFEIHYHRSGITRWSCSETLPTKIEWAARKSLPPRPMDEIMCPELLRTCKAVYNEAIAILYARNKFVCCYSRLRGDRPSVCDEYLMINSFLETIGSLNAAYIQHIQTCYPFSYVRGSDYNGGEPGGRKLIFRRDCIDALNVMTDMCTGLQRIEIAMDFPSNMINPAARSLTIGDLVGPKSVEYLHSHLTKLPALKRVIFSTWHEDLQDILYAAIVNYGWEVRVRDPELLKQDFELWKKEGSNLENMERYPDVHDRIRRLGPPVECG